jgi:hypothetical protein
MANRIRIRRSTGSSAPEHLLNAELAYAEAAGTGGAGTLYIGTGSSGTNAANVVAIGGGGAFISIVTVREANKVLAGPTTGADAAPTFRLLVADDIPSLTSTKITDFTTAAALVGPVSSVNGKTGTVSLTSVDVSAASAVHTHVATDITDFATAAALVGPVSSVNGKTGTVTLVSTDISAASAVHTHVAVDVTDLETTVKGYALSSFAGPTASLSANSQKITNLAAPTDDTDAATKAYVDAARAGLDVKQSVRAATTANINLSSDLENGDAIDGVTLATGDRVLVKNQDTASQNGIYVVQATGAAVRATDFDADAEVTPGAFTFVEEGTANADSGWVLTTNGAITVGTTGLAFAQFSGAGTITAGDGLTKDGSTINAVGTTGRISVSADAIDISTAYAGQTSITTLGTVTTGVWSATAIAATKGGTGLETVPAGSVLGANTLDTVTAVQGGTTDGILTYSASGTSVAFLETIDGGAF